MKGKVLGMVVRAAVDVTQVQEVIRSQELTPVPLAPSTVSGLLNLRGRILMAVIPRK